MKDFSKVRFKGKFRDYQQAVLDKARKHMQDKKIHIVAAPGSGKTVLGLELICRQKCPALVLSPGVTIRQQWGERFAEMFLPEGEKTEDYVSFDLKNPSLITSVTYQALHAAVTKQAMLAEKPEDAFEAEADEDFSSFDIFGFLKANGIKTVCLDEAHHLKSEWQKALEAFIAQIQKEVTVISLTATPPYDSTPAEWNRYVSLCGEIDEEIFVPQLIAQKTLCPHQDFVYFSFPTADEIELSHEYKIKGVRCSEEIIRGGLLDEALAASGVFENYNRLEDVILDNSKGFCALLTCAEYAGKKLPDKLIDLVSPTGKLPKYNITAAETAFVFVTASPDIFSKELSEKMRSALAQNGLIEKKQVCLVTNDKLNKQLSASTGKLNGIINIARSEITNLGDSLRMLVLTDYIKRDMIKICGTQEPLTAMGAVPVFEAIRREFGGVKLAMLSGSVVIVPNCSAAEIGAIADSMGVSYSIKPLENTQHSEIVFSGSNKNKVAIITAAFQKGLVQILVGTKSLLGEGWDSPCINSLILASFVGSFMLSNQMRGRAIRTDKNNPEKVSNIWHLVTAEPAVKSSNQTEQMLFDKVLYDDSTLFSDDFDTLCRRLNCFLAPAYHSEVIESGIDRMDIIRAPFNEQGIEKIDTEMLALASDRQGTKAQWFKALGDSKCPEILDVVEVKNPAMPKGSPTNQIICEVLLCGVTALLARIRFGIDSDGFFAGLFSAILLVAIIVLAIMLIRGLMKILRNKNVLCVTAALANSVLKSLKSIGEIETSGAKANVTTAATDSKNLYCTLEGATIHEKKVFSQCMTEILSAVDNPRYVLMKKGIFGKKYSYSYACPSVLAAKKENVAVLANAMKKNTGKLEFAYTRNDVGHAELLKCRKNSYINASDQKVTSKKIAKRV